MTEEGTAIQPAAPAVPAAPERARPTMSLADVMSPAALQALEQAGLGADLFRAPEPVEVTTIGFDELCAVPSRYPRADKQTRPLVFLSYRLDPTSSQFQDYQGVIFIEAVDPVLGAVVISHAYARADGELMPVTAWVTAHLERGDVFVVAEITTRQQRTVYRPINPTAWAA